MKQPKLKLTDQNIFYMGAVTLIGFSIVGVAIIELFAKVDAYQLIYRGRALWMQLLLGLVFGAAAMLMILPFIKTDVLKELSGPVKQFANAMNWAQIFFISVCAGVGEEILFRVGLQYFFGVWPTAILFVAIHGYLTLSNLKVFSYGLVMTFISAGFGYLYINHGIASAMTAHFFIDFVILTILKKEATQTIQ